MKRSYSNHYKMKRNTNYKQMRQYSIESMLKGIHNIEYKIEELKKRRVEESIDIKRKLEGEVIQKLLLIKRVDFVSDCGEVARSESTEHGLPLPCWKSEELAQD